jgi:ectoine hydroxylase-related dioxygenase (phytanoyl-CoA dioxygenase family)
LDHATEDNCLNTLAQSQYDAFWRDGYLMLDDAVTSAQLAALKRDFSGWVEDSRRQTGPYGEMLDGRPRFDVQPGHSAEVPQLRRVNAPCDVSEAYLDAMRASRMTLAVADLIGPNVKHHHNKINSKQPGSATEVKWHQDFPFTPHSNSDIVTALLCVDDVTDLNGPLEVAPGSHKGPLYPIWHDGVFTGAMSEAVEAEFRRSALICKGRAGTACLMHTRLAHGSVPNASASPRTMFIAVYTAADALPLTPNPVPSQHQGLIVAGTDPHRIRSEPYEVEIPQYPKTTFFAQQSAAERQRM